MLTNSNKIKLYNNNNNNQIKLKPGLFIYLSNQTLITVYTCSIIKSIKYSVEMRH